MENLRKRISVKVVSNEKDFLKHVSKPNFISTRIFDKNYAAIYQIKPVLKINIAVYVGFTVIEFSKRLLCDLHYNFIKKHLDAELLFTDTDSLTYEIKSEDVCKEFYKIKHLFDLSNGLKDLMKYVSEGKLNDEFIGLKSKMYSMKNIDGKESNMAKGVNTAT